MAHLLPMKEGDYPALLQLTRESMAPILRQGLGLDFNDDLFCSMLADADTTTLVLREGEAVVGYVAFYPCEDHLFVNWLVIHPDYRNRGFATMLLQEAERAAANAGLPALRICLQENNAPAIALCEANGFRRLSVEPMGVVMEKAVVAERED